MKKCTFKIRIKELLIAIADQNKDKTHNTLTKQKQNY